MKRSSDVEAAYAAEERVALLRLLTLGEREIDEGKVSPVEQVVARIRSHGQTPEKALSD